MMAPPGGPTPRRCLGLSVSGAANGRLALNLWATSMISPRVWAAFARGEGARLLSWLVLLVQVGAEAGNARQDTISAATRATAWSSVWVPQ